MLNSLNIFNNTTVSHSLPDRFLSDLQFWSSDNDIKTLIHRKVGFSFILPLEFDQPVKCRK